MAIPPGNRLETLLSILVAPMQIVENTMIDLLTKRTVDTAVGAQLDVLGKIVGQDRGGLPDDTYRRYVRARIATNRSTGKREELLRIARLIVNDSAANIYVEKSPLAAIFVRVDGVALGGDVEAALVSFLTAGAPNGVRVVVQSAPTTGAGMFAFDGGDGLGFDDTTAPGTGGQLSDVRDLP